jgi:hypothetical protein
MADIKQVIDVAQRLSKKDTDTLVLQIGMREAAIKKNPALANDLGWEPQYESALMGNATLDELKRLGWKIIDSWNRQIYGIVCTSKGADDPSGKAILQALKLNDAAVIAALASALLALGAPAVIAAAVAPFLLTHFINPAKGVLCDAWGEAIKARDAKSV